MASAIAWRSAGAVAGLVAGKLGELAVSQATLLWGFKDDIDGLRETMEKLQAWMDDADERSTQEQGKLMGFWMKKLKSSAYDVEDLLDEFEAIELMKQSQPKIKLFFSSYNPLLVQLTMAHKMKKLKGDLYSIEEEGHRLNLVPHHIPIRAAGSTSQDSISFTNFDRDTEMVGRDTEKEHIIKLLLKSEVEEDISIIPIVGLGGMGKTTLAQAVYLDKRVEIFDLRVWVYVSKKFNLQRIGEIIISKANISTGSGTSERCVPRINDDLQTIIEDMQNILPTKRYLIILDDMWEEGVVKLKNLKYMLQYGAKGSKIILTTRKQQVVENLNVGFLSEQRKICPVQKSDQINLNSLSVEDCWNVMRQMAFGQDEDLGRLEEIGKKIAEKSRGLPLLARSLGFLMSQDKSTQAWEDIRDKKIILDMEEDQETLQSLMLSFYYMPLDFKLCFTYCAVFPKGFVISGDHLVQQWIALGYIESTRGYRCINYLLGMCFLLISKSSQNIQEHSTASEKLTMHDLVHDLAMIIAGNELIVPDAGKKKTWSGLERRYSRHMQLINYQKQSKALKKFPGKIRSLHFTECSRLQLQHISLSNSKYLRVLDLSGCSIEGKPAPSSKLLPSSIDQLLMLRYLDSSGLLITALPKSLHKLQNMQTLIMPNCALETVPNNIGHLHRLSYLDLSDNGSLTKLPVSLGQLSALSFLKLSGCSRLEALPESVHKLECLQHIDISRCTVLQNLPDKFGSLPKLLFLNLSNCTKLVKLPSNLNSLEHLNLSNCHELLNLPSDFGNLHKLEFLNLSDCYKIQILPESFCQLKHLKDLDLADCHDLKELPECFGCLSGLQYLNLASCSKLQLLPESFSGLFKLKHLNLSYCVRLEKLCSLFGNLKLQVLDMNGCHNLHDLPKSLGNMTSLTRLRMSRGHFPTLVRARYILSRLKLPGCTIHDVHEMDMGECSSIVDLGQLACHDLEIRQLENVKRPEEAERAKLRDNPELQELGLHWTRKSSITDVDRCKLVLQHLIPPRTLEDFALIGYISKDFPKWMLDISPYLPYLMSIRLISLTACDSLPPLGKLPNLRLLHLMNIPNIRKVGKEFFGTEGTCKKLRVIELKSLENLDEWLTTRSGDEEEEFLIPNLHRLHVANCPKLKFRPYPPKSIYWYLEKSNEVLPAHGFGRLSSSTLPFHATIKNCIFSPDKWARLQRLATLEELKILGDSGLRTLPEVTPCLPSLRYLHLHLVGLETLPEWLEQLTTLEEFRIFFCINLTSLPKSIQKLTALKKLTIRGCPRLAESCQGEDAHKIRHIPEVVLDNKIFVQARPIERPEV